MRLLPAAATIRSVSSLLSHSALSLSRLLYVMCLYMHVWRESACLALLYIILLAESEIITDEYSTLLVVAVAVFMFTLTFGISIIHIHTSTMCVC